MLEETGIHGLRSPILHGSPGHGSAAESYCRANLSNVAVVYKNQAVELQAKGRIAESRDKLESAEALYIEARQLDFRVGNLKGVASDLLNLGITYYHAGQRSKAIGAFDECIRLAEEMKEKALLGKAYAGIGTVYAQIKRWDKAIEYYERALSLARPLSGDDWVWQGAVAGANLGIAWFENGDPQRAAKYLREAQARLEDMNIDDELARRVRDYLKKC